MAVISRHWCSFQLQGVWRLAPGNRYPGAGLPGHLGSWLPGHPVTWLPGYPGSGLQTHPGTCLPGHPGTRLGGLPGTGLPACRSPRLRVNSYKYSDGIVLRPLRSLRFLCFTHDFARSLTDDHELVLQT